MITNNDILDAIAALVEKAFPGEPVYRDFTPADFQRPSNLVELSGGTFFPNLTCGAVELRPQVTLTTFTKTAPYHQQDTSELTRRQMLLMGLFLTEYVKVKDRAAHTLDEGKLTNGLDPENDVFMSGLLLIDCEKWREEGITERLLEVSRRELLLDQETMNIV